MTIKEEHLADEIYTCIALARAADSLLDESIAGIDPDESKVGDARRVIDVLTTEMKKVASSIESALLHRQ